MREILFRGKTKFGNWIFGDYRKRDQNVYITEHTGGYSYSNKVILSTVGQYTGLTDKNGVKIFEGDIIEYEEKHGIACYSVVWNEKAACFSVVGYNGRIIGDFTFFASKKCKVVGNIHDELLKGD